VVRRRRQREASKQLPLPAPKPKRREVVETPEQIAKGSIARRAKPSSVPGNVKLTMTFDIPRKLAEKLAARAVREGVNLETVIERLMRAEME
jgi:hypothetical protein